MTHETDADDSSVRKINCIDSLNSYLQSNSVQADLESALVRRLRVAQQFDAHEHRELRALPIGFFYAGDYITEGRRSSGEWIVADDDVVESAGDRR